MANAETPILIKKTVKKAAEGHHGGAWKVAYADFVTAMMAFFLLMWLLNATTEQQRKGLADYFDPSIPISAVSSGGNSVLNGDSLTDSERLAGSVPDGVRAEDEPVEAEPVPDGDAAAMARAAEAAGLESVADQIAAATRAAGGDIGRHFILHLEPEGLVIEIADTSDRPLFAAGSAEPGTLLPRLIDVLVPVLERTTNPIKISGHTDATGGAGFDNWRLSAMRANTARRLMVDRGFLPSRFAEVAGLAANRPLLDDPAAPQNRRISITLLREGAR